LGKLISVSIEEAVEAAKYRLTLSYSMGARCSLLQCEGQVVPELRAIEILTGATAIRIGAGGIDGAEGAITLVSSRADNQVENYCLYRRCQRRYYFSPIPARRIVTNARISIVHYMVETSPG
jgi:hypothetical protein